MAATIVDIANSGEFTGVSSKTMSFTISAGSNLDLVVGSSIRNSGGGAFRNISSITWNGTENLTKAIAKNTTSGSRFITSELWTLKNPTPGTHNIVVTYSGTIDRGCIGAYGVSSVDQTTDVEATSSAEFLANPGGTGDPWVTSITTVSANALVINCIYNACDVDTSPNYSESVGWEVTMNGGGDFSAASGYKSVASIGTVNTGWASGSGADEAALVAIALKSYVAPETSTPLRMLMGMGT